MLDTLFFADNAKRTVFSPASISGLVLWLKSDSGTFQDSSKTTPATADTNPIGAWADQSGTGNDVLQAVAGSRPILKVNILNSRSVVRFDGVDDLLQSATISSLAQPNTVFLAGKYAAADGFAWFDAVTNVASLIDSTGAGGNWRIYAGAALSGGTIDTNYHYRTSLFNGASSQNRLDGSAVVATGDAGTGALDGFTVGGRGGGGNLFPGDIAEVLVYHAALTAPQIAQVETYLASRYAL